jgi:hypothetical protein
VTSRRLAALVLVLGVIGSSVQPTACVGRDLRLEAMRSLVDARFSYLGDPGPSIEAGKRLRADPRAVIYNRDLRVGSAFIYPPIAARPYAALPTNTPEETRSALSIASRLLFLAFVAIVAFLCRPRWLALAALAFFPLVHAVQLNQATLLITVLIGGAIALLDKQRTALAGVALGVACAVKPQLALVLPLLMFHTRRTVAAAAITGVVLLGLSLAYAGVDNHVAYVTRVLPALAGGYAYFANQSFNGLFNRLLVDSNIGVFAMPPPSRAVAIATAIAAVLAYAATLRFIARLPRREGLSPWVLALAWLVATAISPIAWQHHYAPALLIFGMLVVELREGRLPERLWVPVAGA